jgi:hypothetical protein
MRSRLLIPFAMLSLLALVAGSWFVYRALSSGSVPASPAQPEGARVETVSGETVVVVPADMQRASGMTISPLASAKVRPEQLAFATVIDLQPLFDFGTRLAAVRAEREASRTQAGVSQAQVARMQTLFQDDRNVSQKNLQEARAAAQSDQAKLASTEATLAGITASVRQQFGDALARAAASPGTETWRQLVSGQAAVVRVAFPSSGLAPERLTIDAPAGGELNGHKLSAAPQVDPMLQGSAYLYLVPASLPVGARTVAHAVSGQPGVAGVLVPDGAIIWYGDARWAYVKTASERFTRRLVQAAAPVSGGILATGGLRAGDEVVTRGAALLLSEEQRPRGIATQCKDPPECDD